MLKIEVYFLTLNLHGLHSQQFVGEEGSGTTTKYSPWGKTKISKTKNSITAVFQMAHSGTQKLSQDFNLKYQGQIRSIHKGFQLQLGLHRIRKLI